MTTHTPDNPSQAIIPTSMLPDTAVPGVSTNPLTFAGNSNARAIAAAYQTTRTTCASRGNTLRAHKSIKVFLGNSLSAGISRITRRGVIGVELPPLPGTLFPFGSMHTSSCSIGSEVARFNHLQQFRIGNNEDNAVEKLRGLVMETLFSTEGPGSVSK